MNACRVARAVSRPSYRGLQRARTIVGQAHKRAGLAVRVAAPMSATVLRRRTSAAFPLRHARPARWSLPDQA
jgi:hypothetical protein